MTSAGSFHTVPILDWNLLTTDKSKFISELRDALTTVGFLYLRNPPVSPKVTQEVIDFAHRLFELSQDVKDSIIMANSPHFLGYSRYATEITKGEIDHREQFDFGSPYECRWTLGSPDYPKLWGPPQWPPEGEIPGFRQTFTEYLAQVEALSFQFIELMALALLLPENAFKPFFDTPHSNMQHRSKIVKYPPVNAERGNQGVGPHFDSGFLTFLLQASPHIGLQVQNPSGEWINVPPIDNTLVVNLGKALENVTQGVALATSHRVLSPLEGQGPRYSVPFFQSISQTIRLPELKLNIPKEILDLRNRRYSKPSTDSVNYGEYDHEISGTVSLIGRIKSHPDVAERHYPALFAKYFPHGMPSLGSAY